MVDVAKRTARFFAHESCGRCTPCRVGTARVTELLEALDAGVGRDGDLQRLEDLCRGIAGHTFCPMGDALVAPIMGTLSRFRDEFEQHLRQRVSFAAPRQTSRPSATQVGR